MDGEVLVLNSDYEPLNVCNVHRAIGLVCLGKADILHTNRAAHRSVSGLNLSPSVVKLRHHVRRPIPELRLSRRSIFARDNYTCQYCGQVAKELTVDHVIPKRMGGKSTWENLVCSCRRCNTRKGDKSLTQANLELRKEPRKPKYVPFISLTKYLDGKRNEVWRDYLPVLKEF
ncbi:MAG TPA: HNH endonuclease [Armatimonadota bacterium]|jgi:5-methylcytosine-specific restriction endonuclease McrA